MVEFGFPEREGEDPLPDKKEEWSKYNTRVAEIREHFYTQQAALRKTLDDKAAEAHEEYDRELEKLRNWFNDEIAKARSEFTLAV